MPPTVRRNSSSPSGIRSAARGEADEPLDLLRIIIGAPDDDEAELNDELLRPLEENMPLDERPRST